MPTPKQTQAGKNSARTENEPVDPNNRQSADDDEDEVTQHE